MLTATIAVATTTSLFQAGCSPVSNPTAGQSKPSGPATSTTNAPAASPAVARGTQRGIGDVPWAQVGPGWMLAMWTPVTPHRPGNQPPPGDPTPETATDVLFLVSPAGDRYSITEFPAADGTRNLADWSGDGSHALLTPEYGTKGDSISVDLHTGARTTVPRDGTLKYTRPDGKALLVSTGYNGNKPGTLTRIDMAGNEEFVYPTKDLGGAGQFGGGYVESPDGTQLVLATANLGNNIVARTDNSLVVMGNDGSIVRTLPVPMPKATCSPVKWWAAGVILTNCDLEKGAGEQLWEVPLDGDKSTALTAVNTHDNAPGFDGNYGNSNAFQLAGSTFLPTAGACGSTFVSRLTPDGHTERLKIPGVSDSAGLVGASGDKLTVVGQVGCGGGKSLVAYDPSANTSTVLFGPPISNGGVKGVLLYPIKS
jgi:TolB protein